MSYTNRPKSRWDDLFHVHEEVNKLFNSAWCKDCASPASARSRSYPVINVVLNDHLLIFQIEVSGIPKAALSVSVHNQQLIIKAEENAKAEANPTIEHTRKTPDDKPRQNPRFTNPHDETRYRESHSNESHFRQPGKPFERRIELPPNAITESISARCENGMLEILIPLRETVKSREIPLDAR